MRKLFIQVIVFSLFTINLSAQNKKVKEGDYYYEHFQFVDAAASYESALEDSPEDYDLAYKLAHSHLKYYNYQKAEIYFSLVEVNASDKYPMSVYWVAEIMKIRGQYEKAQKKFENLINGPYFSKLEKGYDEKSKLELKGCEMAILELKKPNRDYHFLDIRGEINSSGHDYKVEIYLNDSSLILTSDRLNMETISSNDQYRFEKKDNGWTESSDEDDFYEIVNGKYNDAVGCFSSDRKTYYFTRCDGKSKGSQYKEFNCLIYETKLSGGKWTKPEKLNHHINPHGEWTANPALSVTNDTLFFVSKRAGGKGMNDIWYSVRDLHDHWGKAKNFEQVNTPFTDVSPFLDKDGNFYFASNGRESFGGLDVYIATGPNKDSIRNLGLPFNSNMDDFHFTLGDSIGYLTSNREGGKGGDDIYVFSRRSERAVLVEVSQDSLKGAESVTITGEIYDAITKQPRKDIQETLVDGAGKAIKTTKSNENGEFRFENLPADQSYTVVIEDADANIAHTSEVIVENIEVVTSSERATVTQFENIYFDSRMWDLRPEAVKVLEELVKYLKDHPDAQVEINANTDALGSVDYNKELSQKRGNASYEFLRLNDIDNTSIVINAMGESNELASNESQIGRQLNRRVEFKVIGGGTYSPEAMTHIVAQTTSLNSIANQFGMTVEELRILNGIDSDHVQAFKPLRVRNTGDDDLIDPLTMANANKKQKRNKRYYKQKEARMAAYQHAYDELNASYENYEMITQQLKIVEGEDYYVANKKNTLWRVAKLYGMSVDELISFNGFSNDMIYINQPLKVKVSNAPVAENQHRVLKNETLDIISEMYGVSKKNLIKWNEFKGYTLRPGMILFIEEPPVTNQTDAY